MIIPGDDSFFSLCCFFHSGAKDLQRGSLPIRFPIEGIQLDVLADADVGDETTSSSGKPGRSSSCTILGMIPRKARPSRSSTWAISLRVCSSASGMTEMEVVPHSTSFWVISG